MSQAAPRSLALDVLLHAVGAAVEAALAPAGEIEHRLAQGLRGDGAGVDRDAADAAAASRPPAPSLPSLAAWIAARRPAGPLPMTIMSKRVKTSPS